ncbi:MAG TPA: hypothetical protein VK928_00455, partial [Longimicrobiales bacterium]|nr:hypothetical protein [Longimicrobiales bacterium]
RTTRTIGITPRTLAPALGLDSTQFAGRLLRRINTVDLSWNRTLTSAFEREVAEPGVAYKLGLGDLESFSIIRGDTAVRAQELGEVRIGTGIEMVRGLTLNASYGMRDLETFDPRTGNRAQQDRTPSASLIWRDVRLPAFAARFITAFSGSLGITLRETESFFRAENEQRRSGTDLSFPFSVNVGFPRAITMSYNGSLAAGETIDPTGSAERATAQHNFRISTVFQPPERWRAKLNGPIELQLNYIDQQQRQCRFVPGLVLADGCVAFIDVGTRTANLQVSSKLSDLDVGMLLNYVGRDNAIGMRNGSTQFQLQMYARFNFTAGRMPDRMMR